MQNYWSVGNVASGGFCNNVVNSKKVFHFLESLVTCPHEGRFIAVLSVPSTKSSCQEFSLGFVLHNDT